MRGPKSRPKHTVNSAKHTGVLVLTNPMPSRNWNDNPSRWQDLRSSPDSSLGGNCYLWWFHPSDLCLNERSSGKFRGLLWQIGVAFPSCGPHAKAAKKQQLRNKNELQATGRRSQSTLALSGPDPGEFTIDRVASCLRTHYFPVNVPIVSVREHDIIGTPWAARLKCRLLPISPVVAYASSRGVEPSLICPSTSSQSGG